MEYFCSWRAERKSRKAKGNLRQSATKWSRVQPYDPTKSHACEYGVRGTEKLSHAEKASQTSLPTQLSPTFNQPVKPVQHRTKYPRRFPLTHSSQRLPLQSFQFPEHRRATFFEIGSRTVSLAWPLSESGQPCHHNISHTLHPCLHSFPFSVQTCDRLFSARRTPMLLNIEIFIFLAAKSGCHVIPSPSFTW